MPLEALPREILGAVSVGAVSTQGGARHASRRGQTGGVVAKPGTALAGHGAHLLRQRKS